MTEREFLEEAKKLGILLSEDQLEKFREYAKFLLEYNIHTNLTAIKTNEEVYLKHFFDSIVLLKYFDLKGKKVLDIGCGAGFPGVPLKICEPSIELYSLDSNGKKTQFLEKLKNVLNIEFDVINDRAEEYALSKRESFDVVTSRAVTTMSVLAELSIPFVKVGGYFIPFKGALDDNLEGGLYAIRKLGGNVEKILEYELPIENSKRCLVFVNKKCKTDGEYPRRFDKISKKPLQKDQ